MREGRQIKIKAPAKINLALDVTGRREDGYHEVRMVMQAISLCDDVELRVCPGSNGQVTCEVRWERVPVSGSGNCPEPPVLPADNLAVRAVNLLREEFDIRQAVDIRLTKRIPAAAGLAGGSTDAAAALRGANALFELGLTREELALRSRQLGADVAFCLLGGTALAEGIGEKLSVLPDMPPCTILIGKPGIDVSTQFVYTNYREDAVSAHPDIEGMCGALAAKDLSGVVGRLCNVLESVTVPLHPVIDEIKSLLRERGAAGVLMSGSGPTVYGIFEEPECAEAACDALKKSGLTEAALLAVPQKREEYLWQ